ncbi:MAG: nicotinate phosphoribosyltransferase [Candidatus Omnitrophica bacterium]|nr:nicotinate phosphoribosyltransferase [Candidatus Omnitrophota bacterium]
MCQNISLKTDLYELTMAAGYFQNNFEGKATFELYCHTLPRNRSFLVVCGLEQVLNYILSLKFTNDDVRFLKSLPAFQNVTPKFFRYLKNFKFSGNVWAMPEGEICFANEPMVQVEAPMIEAQILETYLLSLVNVETSVATKAARVVQAACCDGKDRAVVDFGSRRAHGPQAGVLAARASYVAGCAGTSNVYAGRQFGIPVFGTMAHSWVQAFEDEKESFARYCSTFPGHAILLIDTYRTLSGLKKAISLRKDIKGVRLDSGDLNVLSRKVRRILDQNNLHQVEIIASGNLNEYKIQDLVKAKAPIDIFGVGTEMVVSKDAPALDLTYKLVQVRNKRKDVRYTAKLSPGKHTVPGRKQVFREFDAKGVMVKDQIGLASESPSKKEKALLKMFLRNGKRCRKNEPISQARVRLQKRLTYLPQGFKSILQQRNYKVWYKPSILKLERNLRRK